MLRPTGSQRVSFAFVASLAKWALGGECSGNAISLDREHEAIAGFAHEELKGNYSQQIKEAAKYLNASEAPSGDEMALPRVLL